MNPPSRNREIIAVIFATAVLTGIYINLRILMNQTFFQIFEGDLGLTTNTFAVFIIILIFLVGTQYLIRQESSA